MMPTSNSRPLWLHFRQPRTLARDAPLPAASSFPDLAHEEGLDAVVSAVRSMPYGDPLDTSNLMGPLISEKQRDRVLGYIDSARRDGGPFIRAAESRSTSQTGSSWSRR